MIGPVQSFKPDTKTEDGTPAFTPETIIYGLLENVRTEMTGEYGNSDRSFGAKVFLRECVYKLQEYIDEEMQNQ